MMNIRLLNHLSDFKTMKNKNIIWYFAIVLIIIELLSSCSKINLPSIQENSISGYAGYIEQRIKPYGLYNEFFENDIYPSYDSAILAWKESYILDAYLDYYCITLNENWLNKFEIRVNSILSAVELSTGRKLISSRYSANIINNGSFENAEEFGEGFEIVDNENPPVFTDCSGNVLIDFGTKFLKFKEDGILIKDFSSEDAGLYRLRFWVKGIKGSQVNIFLDGSSLKSFQLSGDWEAGMIDLNIETDQGEHRVEISSPKGTLIDLVSIQKYKEHYVHYGMFLKVLLRGIILGAWIDENKVRSWLNETNATYYKPEFGFYIGLTYEGKNYTSLNAAAMMGTANIYAWKVFKEDNYKIIADNIAKVLRNSMSESNDTYIFPYNGYVENGVIVSNSVEDIDHGNEDVEFILHAFENEIEFTKEDMTLLSNTFVSNLWNGNVAEPSFNKFVDGSGGIYEQAYGYVNG